MQTIKWLFGTIMILLVMVSVLCALGILVLAEARWLVGLSMQLYWRWRASLRQVQQDIAYDHEPQEGRAGTFTHEQLRQQDSEPESGSRWTNDHNSPDGDKG